MLLMHRRHPRRLTRAWADAVARLNRRRRRRTALHHIVGHTPRRRTAHHRFNHNNNNNTQRRRHTYHTVNNNNNNNNKKNDNRNVVDKKPDINDSVEERLATAEAAFAQADQNAASALLQNSRGSPYTLVGDVSDDDEGDVDNLMMNTSQNIKVK